MRPSLAGLVHAPAVRNTRVPTITPTRANAGATRTLDSIVVEPYVLLAEVSREALVLLDEMEDVLGDEVLNYARRAAE
jgi:hypothetical protein